ncbi:unnamed protein product, partial [Mesorhabditis belari]|uniref:Histone-lysine N-methyltransferase, H3 lysine-79 specific n=1 Tax=Mesorhabditis belari TaxID=2138241 RepID=A0AAF3ECW0_9BILA
MDNPKERHSKSPALHRKGSTDKTEVETASTSSIDTADSPTVACKTLKLQCVYGYPVTGEKFIVYWKETGDNAEPAVEVIENIKIIMGRLPEIKTPIQTFCDNEGIDLNNYTHISYDKITRLVAKYNKAASTSFNLWSGQTRPGIEEWSHEICSQQLLQFVCSTAFNRAVPDVNRLNKHYEAFSSEVYGETSYEQMELMLEEIKPTENDVFVDLGSGVGHLVCYVAGRTKVKKAVGIEKAKFPSSCAIQMDRTFKNLMRWHGKRVKNFDLYEGDFLDQKFRKLITEEATIIFINNFAFTADLDKKIKDEIIKNCLPGTKIISTKAYARNKSIADLSERDLNDLAMMLDVSNLPTVKAPASWTGGHVPYFLHVVDPGKIERYFEYKNKKSSSTSSMEDRRSINSSKNSQREKKRKIDEASNEEKAREVEEKIVDDEKFTLPDWVLQRRIDGKSSSRESSASKGLEMHTNPGGSTIATVTPKVEEIGDDRKFVLVSTQPRKRAKASLPTYQEVNWDDDSEYFPSKKGRPTTTKDCRPRGRPKKGSTPATPITKVRARLSEEARSGVDEMHEEIVRQQKEEFARIPLTPALVDGAVILDPSSPLDALLISIRQQFLEHQAHVLTETFRAQLIDEVKQETNKRSELMERVRTSTAFVDNLLQQGVANLRARLLELDMSDVETPSELLNRSKQIVHNHKEVTQKCSALEAEVAALESRLRAHAPYGDRLIEKINNTDPNLLIDPINPDPYMELIQTACLESGCQIVPTRLESEAEAHAQESMTSPGVAVSAARRPRQRSRASASKRAAAGAKPEETSEEMERQIQEIVQKALKVDSAAKEKERRARGNPEKRGGKGANANVQQAAISGISAAPFALLQQPAVVCDQRGIQLGGSPNFAMPHASNQPLLNNGDGSASMTISTAE